jgi:hypothetical protein
MYICIIGIFGLLLLFALIEIIRHFCLFEIIYKSGQEKERQPQEEGCRPRRSGDIQMNGVTNYH